MFVHELTPAQQRALLVLARQVIDADARLALSEVERLDRLYAEAGLPAETAAAPDAVGDLPLLFETPRARAVVLLELLLVAHADGRLDAKENASIRAVAARLEVDADVLDRLEAWAYRYAGLVRDGEAFGRDGGTTDP